MTHPVLVEVMRGDVVESRHRGSVLVVDSDGKPVFARGDTDAPIFPRSAVKAIQALPLFETGAVDRFGLSEACNWRTGSCCCLIPRGRLRPVFFPPNSSFGWHSNASKVLRRRFGCFVIITRGRLTVLLINTAS
jgi:hypothetical protein